MKQLLNKNTGDIANFIGLYVEGGRFELVVRLSENDKKLFTFYYSSIEELNENWEDYEDDMFYIVKSDGGVDSRFKTNDGYEEKFKQIGNYFETKEEAEKEAEKLKAWKRLKDTGFKFKGLSFEPSKDFGSIFFEITKDKYKTYYDCVEFEDDLNLLFGDEK